MKRTNTKQFRDTVTAYLTDSLYDFEGTAAERLAEIKRKFTVEYDYEENRRRFPNTQQRVREWLSGLPLHIAYTYHDIIETAELWHECKLTEKQADMVIENWFNFLAFHLVSAWRRAGLI